MMNSIVKWHQHNHPESTQRLSEGNSLSIKHTLINALLFQVCWFLAIFGEWYWVIPPLALLLGHFYLTASRLNEDIKLV